MKIIKVLVDEMASGCKRCDFCIAHMYCSFLDDRKTLVPDEPYKRRSDCPLVYDFGEGEIHLNARIAELEAVIDQLIEAGNALDVPPDDFSEEQKDWREIVKEWKESKE